MRRALPVLLLLAGCAHVSAGGTLTVLAASSLTGSFTTLGQQFEADHPGTRVRFSFGSSATLARQVASGAPADVVATASASSMAAAVESGDVGRPSVFASNAAEIAVSPRAARPVRSLADLAAAGVRVALCAPAVPCGALARDVLAKAHVTVRPATLGLDVKQVLGLVSRGEVDAGIVYVTDVRAAGPAVAGVTIPAAVNAVTRYPIAVARRSGHGELAAAFRDFVLSARGQDVLRLAGFAPP